MTARATAKRAGTGGPTLVTVGASAGGPGALATVLSALPKTYRGTIVVLQHVDAQFAVGMASWLGEQIALPVDVAKEGDTLAPGMVVLAAGDDVHLTLGAAGLLRYVRADADATRRAYAPSIDVFFESVAAHWRGPAVGVLLTGMGRDGAQGLRAMRDAGAVTIAQDQASSVVYGMPKAAAELAAASEILPLGHIGPRLLQLEQTPPLPLRQGAHG